MSVATVIHFKTSKDNWKIIGSYSKNKLFRRCCVKENDLSAVAPVTENVRYEFSYPSREMSLILLSEGASAPPAPPAPLLPMMVKMNFATHFITRFDLPTCNTTAVACSPGTLPERSHITSFLVFYQNEAISLVFKN